MKPEAATFAPEQAMRLAVSLLKAHGATDGNASTVAEHLIESNLEGLDSHGLIRIPQYLDEIARGEIDPAASPAVSRREGPRVWVEGNRAFGQVAGNFAVERAVTVAGELGLALVTVRQAGHAGRLGAYTEAIARRGQIGIAFCSGPRSGHRVAPFGAREGRMATNPISYAFPAGAVPLVADFSTSATTEGNIRSLRNHRQPAPEGVLRDAAGVLTTDPNALYTDPPGTLQPLGGADFGHKGTALGLLVEVMATLLVGDDPMDASRFGNNLTLIAVALPPSFPEHAERLLGYLLSAAPIDPGAKILMPGDRERETRFRTRQISIDATTWEEIERLARERNVGLPAPIPHQKLSP